MPLIRRLIPLFTFAFSVVMELFVDAVSKNNDLIVKYINYPFLKFLAPPTTSNEIIKVLYLAGSTVFWFIVISGILVLLGYLFLNRLWRKFGGKPVGEKDLERALCLVQEEKKQFLSTNRRIHEAYQQILSDPVRESIHVEKLFEGIAHDIALNFNLKTYQYRFVWIAPHPDDNRTWVAVHFKEGESLSEDESSAIDTALSQKVMPDKNARLKDTWKSIQWESCLTFRNSGVFKLGFAIFILKSDKVSSSSWKSFQELCQVILPLASIDIITTHLLKYNLKGVANYE